MSHRRRESEAEKQNEHERVRNETAGRWDCRERETRREGATAQLREPENNGKASARHEINEARAAP